MRSLNYGRHLIEEDDIDFVVSVLRGDLITQGPVVEKFEATLAEKVGAKFAIAVTSGTAALHVACLAAGMKPGDIGITSALTFVASANAMLYCGARAEVCDISADTLCMNPTALKEALRENSKASVIIPVHFGGLAAHSREIREIAGDRIIIEDASHSLGASYECGQPVGCGSYADMTVFSFHPVKPITTGEGGAVVTNDPELARLLRLYRSHGIERDDDRMENPDGLLEEGERRPWYYEQQLLGYNYRLTDIQAALGLSQLGKLGHFINLRREIVQQYDAAFGDLPNITIPQESKSYRFRSGQHLYIVEFDFDKIGCSRLDVMKKLREYNVGTQVHYIPVYRQPFHSGRMKSGHENYPNTEIYYRGCLSLPLFPGITELEVERVITAIRNIVL
ncbi:UDP-4-amino-4,6-dideoxy-N-acetyl-beta-L-altrosamine transaminase [Kiloniella antarctica]|uniref:UDP-4-amino-4, 6-dideoxy-N-acetyl-beta-L-altrosamine transaminase n=1 Tax=Kiloniella antarctica TaxID=1550907 RepID=A0ABW5BPQ7_9PROT